LIPLIALISLIALIEIKALGMVDQSLNIPSADPTPFQSN
jgi:hypothetical protein